jgi:hypothetical protein
MTLSKTLYNRIKAAYPDLIHGGEVERYSIELGFKASTGSRVCRKMAEDGYIKAEYNGKGHVSYIWVPTEQQNHRQDLTSEELLKLSI